MLASMGCAASFWVQYLKLAGRTLRIQNALAEQGEVSQYLHTKVLEWLECLSLLDKLPGALEASEVLSKAADSSKQPSVLLFIQDVTRFLVRHYQTIATWPLQIYSSAIIFSPQVSVVRKNDLDKIPRWLRKNPLVEYEWASLIQTLVGHSSSVKAVAFSPDGKRIPPGSRDSIIKLWDAVTGNLEKTQAGHSGSVFVVAFPPDGKPIASGSWDMTIKLWDAAKISKALCVLLNLRGRDAYVLPDINCTAKCACKAILANIDEFIRHFEACPAMQIGKAIYGKESVHQSKQSRKS
ncbi:MAG: hypothetical protein Q9168_004923 [Polycauliona sp. 1 TL-2023]